MSDGNLPRVRRIVKAFRGGSSWPVLVETDAGRCVMKWRGNAEGPAVNAADLLALGLARAAGIPVPSVHLLDLDETAIDAKQDPELNDLVRRSLGTNLGVEEIAAFTPYEPRHRAEVPAALRGMVLAFDLLMLNMDRTESNPNMVITSDGLLCWDFAAAMELRLVLEGRTIDERRFYPLLRQHPFFGDALPDLSTRFGPLAALTEDLLRDLPDAWLPPSASREAVRDRLHRVLGDAESTIQRRHAALQELRVESAEERTARHSANRRAFEEAVERLAKRSGSAT